MNKCRFITVCLSIALPVSVAVFSPFSPKQYVYCIDPIGLAVLKSIKEHPEKWNANSRDSLSLDNEGGQDGHLLLRMGVSYSGSKDYRLNEIPYGCHADIKAAAKPFLDQYRITIPEELKG